MLAALFVSLVPVTVPPSDLLVVVPIQSTQQAPAGSTEPATAEEAERIGSARRRKILEFVDEYHAAISRDNFAAISFLQNAYPDEVLYFGKPTSRDDVLSDKRKFLERWPRRSYRPRSESADLRCDQSFSTCHIQVTVDYSASDLSGAKVSSGVAVNSITVTVTESGPKIVSESGFVQKRH